MRLRPYQHRAVEAVLAEWQRVRSTLLVLPTGLGKTVCFSEIAARTEKRVLILAHSEELIWQARAKVRAVTGIEPDIEMATYRADSAMWRKRIIVGTIQTQRARMTRFDPMEFGAVIIDEAHHSAADSYRRVIAHYQANPDCRFLGVTATPDRTDGYALGGVFDTVAYQLPLHEAIDEGWLVPIRQQPIRINGLDWSGVRVTAGDLNAQDLGQAMLTERVPQEIADTVYRELAGRKAIVFVPTVAIATLVSDILNRHQQGCAAVVSGAMPKDERKSVLDAFAERRLQIVVNCMVLTEGFDDPSVEVVVLARPTKSRALFAQMVGRGTRPLPGVVDPHEAAHDRRGAIAGSRKPSVEVMDLRGNVGRHKLVTAADILAGKPLPDLEPADVTLRANEILEREGRRVTIEEAIEQAARELASEKAKAEEARQRREAEAAAKRERRRHLRARAHYERGALVDPFDVTDVDHTPEHSEAIERPLSDKQRALLVKAGVPVDQISVANARRLLSEVIRRFESGQCTYKQARVLKAHGYDTKMSRAEASEVLDRIFGKRKPAPTTAGPASQPAPAPNILAMERF